MYRRLSLSVTNRHESWDHVVIGYLFVQLAQTSFSDSQHLRQKDYRPIGMIRIWVLLKEHDVNAENKQDHAYGEKNLLFH